MKVLLNVSLLTLFHVVKLGSRRLPRDLVTQDERMSVVVCRESGTNLRTKSGTERLENRPESGTDEKVFLNTLYGF